MIGLNRACAATLLLTFATPNTWSADARRLEPVHWWLTSFDLQHKLADQSPLSFEPRPRDRSDGRPGPRHLAEEVPSSLTRCGPVTRNPTSPVRPSGLAGLFYPQRARLVAPQSRLAYLFWHAPLYDRFRNGWLASMGISKPVDAELLGTDFPCRKVMRFLGMGRRGVLSPETRRQRKGSRNGQIIFIAFTRTMARRPA